MFVFYAKQESPLNCIFRSPISDVVTKMDPFEHLEFHAKQERLFCLNEKIEGRILTRISID